MNLNFLSEVRGITYNLVFDDLTVLTDRLSEFAKWMVWNFICTSRGQIKGCTLQDPTYAPFTLRTATRIRGILRQEG